MVLKRNLSFIDRFFVFRGFSIIIDNGQICAKSRHTFSRHTFFLLNYSMRYLLIILSLFTFYFSQEIFEGYTLFSPIQSNVYKTYLIDNDLNIFKEWSHQNSPASMPYLISGQEIGWENTLLIYPYLVDNPTMIGGGVGGGIQCLNWNGDLLWDYQLSNEIYQHHHDIQPLPNGNILLIAWERKSYQEAYEAGREIIDNPLNEMWSTAIFEIQPDIFGNVEVVWEWHLWDHLIQDVDSNRENYGQISNHPELFNINCGIVGDQFNASGDWMHINAIDYNIELDQIVFSSKFQNEIYIIDHSTTTEEAASHSGGRYGKGGDFIYRWGNPQNYDRGTSDEQILSNPHGVNWINELYPGGGNLLLLNNDMAEAIEFIPPINNNGNYLINDNHSYGPNDIVWNSNYLYTIMQGGAFRLPNGNTLLTDCDNAKIYEVNLEGLDVWSYSIPGAGETNNIQIARAQKYDVNYFDGLNINSNNKIVNDFKLNNIYPNPFNPNTLITYEVSITSNVKISVYNSNGQLIEILSNQIHEPGNFNIIWNAQDLSSGIYIIKLIADNYVDAKKIMFIK